MQRRDFIEKTGIACVGILAGGGLLSSCTPLYYAQYSIEDNRIKIAKTEFVEHDYVIIKNEKLPAPIYVLKTEEVYTAVLMLCTHKACEVTPFGQELHCPCHGSEFDNTGTVLKGPAEEPLKKFKIESDDRNLFIS
jgi:cytochrome b6-f complex iron-sulfur subunit